MPTYAYRCQECGNQFEIRQSFTDDPLELCETCGGRLRKMLGDVGVVFKGGGFYSTDARKRPKSSSPAGSPSDGSPGTPAAGAPSTGGSSSDSSSSDTSGGSSSNAPSTGASSGAQSGSSATKSTASVPS